MLHLHTIKKGYKKKDVVEMGWKGMKDFCKDLGIPEYSARSIWWPGDTISIDCSKEIEKELLPKSSKKKCAVHFIVHGRLYNEIVYAYELGDCMVLTQSEFDKLF